MKFLIMDYFYVGGQAGFAYHYEYHYYLWK